MALRRRISDITSKIPKPAQYVAVVWDGTGTFSGTFATASGKLQIVDMMGNARTVPTGQ